MNKCQVQMRNSVLFNKGLRSMFSYYCTRDKYQPNLISQGTGPTIANLIPYIGADRSNHLPSELWEEAAGTSDHTCPSFDVLPGVWTTPGENNSQKQRTQQTR